MNLEIIAHLTSILSNEGPIIFEEFQQNGENIKNKGSADSSSYPIYLQQPMIDWYFIYPYGTYYQDVTDTDHVHRLSTDLDEQKIVVNVINDNPSLKSNTNEVLTKKQVYISPDTIIGSETMEDLFQVINNHRSTSMIERVIIIDRPDLDSLGKSTPITTSTFFMTPSTEYTAQQPTYYDTQQVAYQQPKIYMSMPSDIYLTTTYVADDNSYYPFVYFRY